MRVLVFGDSITQGYWAVTNGWVDQVRLHYDSLKLKDLNGKDQPTVFNLGISGNTSQDVAKRVKAEVIARTENNVLPIVLLQIGVNDSYEDSSGKKIDVETYKQNLRNIINDIKSNVASIIFIGSSANDDALTAPAPWRDDLFYKSAEIEKYENAMRQISEEFDIEFIPVFEEFKKKLEAGETLLADGLHPNIDGHKAIYEIVMPKLQELLK